MWREAMNLTRLFEMLFAAVVVGAVVTAWREIKGRLLAPVRSTDGVECFTVLVISGEAAGLESAVKGLRWLNDTGRAEMRLIIADDGADEEALRRAAILCDKNGGLLTEPGSLGKTVKDNLWRETDTQP